MKLKSLFAILLIAVVAFSAMAQSKAIEALKKAGVQTYANPVPVADFTLKDLAGKPVTLSEHRGKVVFLNFWATWCPPCRKEMPSMERLHNAMKGKQFVMLAASVAEDEGTVKRFVASNRLTFPVLLDSDGRLSDVHSVTGIPTTLIIDAQGRAVARTVGGKEWDSKAIIDALTALASEK